MSAPAGAGLELPGRDPAVEMCREAFAAMDAASADPAVHAVADAARFLLLHGHLMPPSEQAAMREELAAADPVDVPVVLAAWHTIAVLCAGPQDGPQGRAEAVPASEDPGRVEGAPRATRLAARAIPGPPMDPEGAHSAAEGSQAPDAATETPDAQKPATEPPAARVAATEAHTDTQES